MALQHIHAISDGINQIDISFVNDIVDRYLVKHIFTIDNVNITLYRPLIYNRKYDPKIMSIYTDIDLNAKNMIYDNIMSNMPNITNKQTIQYKLSIYNLYTNMIKEYIIRYDMFVELYDQHANIEVLLKHACTCVNDSNVKYIKYIYSTLIDITNS